MRGRVDGLLVMPPDADGTLALLDALSPGLPAVLLNHDETRRATLASVGIDNHGGAHAMTEHLVDARLPPHRPHLRARATTATRASASAAFATHSPTPSASATRSSSPATSPRRGGAEAARLLIAGAGPVRRHLLRQRHDGARLHAACSPTPASAIRDDVGVAGFDDIPLAHYAVPPLTTMKVRIAELGERAMNSLLARMRGGATCPRRRSSPRRSSSADRPPRQSERDHNDRTRICRTGGTLTWPLPVT